jgi:hypothetical protein
MLRRRAQPEPASAASETRGGDGGPSGMARDRCPVGLRRCSGLSWRWRRFKRYGQGPGQGGLRRSLPVLVGSASAAAAEESQAGGAPATSVLRGQGGAKRRSQLSRGESDTGGAEHARGKQPCPNECQQHRVPGTEPLSATGESPPPVSRFGQSNPSRWTACHGVPQYNLGSCWKYCYCAHLEPWYPMISYMI